MLCWLLNYTIVRYVFLFTFAKKTYHIYVKTGSITSVTWTILYSNNTWEVCVVHLCLNNNHNKEFSHVITEMHQTLSTREMVTTMTDIHWGLSFHEVEDQVGQDQVEVVVATVSVGAVGACLVDEEVPHQEDLNTECLYLVSLWKCKAKFNFTL